MSDFYQVPLNTDDNLYKNVSGDNTNDEFYDSNTSTDVLIKINNHETANNTYVRYCIDINIKSERHYWFLKVREKSWNVLRRYSDFTSLRNALIKRYPACLVPPLPGKVNSLIPWRAANQINDTDFIDCRRQRLEWFLTRLISHPKLVREVIVLEFVKNNENWSEIQTSVDQKVSDIINWRWINVQSRLIQFFDTSSQLNDIVKSKSLSDDAVLLIERGRKLQKNIHQLLVCLSKIEEQTLMMHNLYKNYSEAFHDWCTDEEEIGDALQSFSHLCENFSNLVDSPSTSNRLIVLTQSGTCSESVCNGLSWYEMSLLLQELYDYGESWIALGGRMALLQRKINRQKESIDDLSGQLERLKKGQPPKSGPLSQLKNKFSKSSSTSDLSQLASLTELELVEQNKILISITADKELFDKCVVEEIQHFESIRSRDLKLVMHSYASNQLVYSQQCLRLWKRAKQTVE